MLHVEVLKIGTIYFYMNLCGGISACACLNVY